MSASPAAERFNRARQSIDMLNRGQQEAAVALG
jgi:hypothetical protein